MAITEAMLKEYIDGGQWIAQPVFRQFTVSENRHRWLLDVDLMRRDQEQAAAMELRLRSARGEVRDWASLQTLADYWQWLAPECKQGRVVFL